MPLLKLELIVLIALTACLARPVYAVEMEDGPAYLTDSHGASGVVHAFLELSEVAPEYDKYWKGSLDWLISVAKRDDQGHVYWVKQALEGILVNLRARATQTDNDGAVLIAWPALKNPKVVETGYCYGQAGLVVPLLRMAEVLPELKLSDGTTPLSLANGSLRYLMSVARQARGGYVWPHMRHTETSRNIGYGSGTGGIGWALLRGAQVNRNADPEFAVECMKYAHGAAVFAVQLVESNQGKSPLRGPGGDAGFGVCGGAGGAGHFLMLYAEDVSEEDAAMVKRIHAVAETIARAVIASAVELEDGTRACPDRVNFKRINIALDYGQTGVVLGLAGAGKYLENDDFIKAAKKVADYIAKRAVPEGGGLKFAQFGPLPEQIGTRGARRVQLPRNE